MERLWQAVIGVDVDTSESFVDIFNVQGVITQVSRNWKKWVSEWQGIQLLDLGMIKTRIKWAGHFEGNFGATRALYEIDNEKSLRYIGKSLAKNYIAATLSDTILPYSTGEASKEVWLIDYL